MHAEVGDWLIVKSHTEGRQARRAAILAVHPGGVPPYTVRWTDDDREGLVFPGPDADVISGAQLAELNRAQDERNTRMQSALIADSDSS